MDKIVQISDIHFCIRDKSHDSRKNLSLVLNKINKLYDEYILVLSGDMVMKADKAHYIELYKYIRNFTQNEIYVIPGNHDDIALMRELAKQADFFKIQDTLEIGNNDIVFLDSSEKGEYLGGGKIDLSHFEVIKSKLRENSNKIVFIHHPPFKIGAEWFKKICLDNGDLFMKSLLKINNLKYLSYGHCHNYFIEERENTVFLSCPSSWIQFDHSCHHEMKYDQKREIGFNVFHLSDDIYHDTVTVSDH
ncbi:metallophosphoesterase [Vibrio mangrovi]|uniref:3',5'-cyclic adenosine monophosphate phosphodiesterase CpdA n=1 Tax=Vibrio mangrovi TaxID=474394 RepID=A0A1Y6IV88_9VIBR|nr:metallophosphoesterase [Vibrio mangrovi]MDW6002229.1 metallophosphoesterase [Vibrio mangrovi]SMS01574.1 3',5'-cyclic adenosine monophosphate phosphodiesterase CpdA [Vibrio mangrovi]